MPDSRIDYFRQILSRLPNGDTHVQLPEGPADDVNALGVTIAELAASMATSLIVAEGVCAPA